MLANELRIILLMVTSIRISGSLDYCGENVYSYYILLS